MIDLSRIKANKLARHPYDWAFIDHIFSPKDASELVQTFPRDHFKTVAGYDGEKGYEYEARALIPLGESSVSRFGYLSSAWQDLASDLLSTAYRNAMSELVGRDLEPLPMEVNVFHYGRRAWLGPHVDLPDKLVTHVFYFNDVWDPGDGGCLTVLNSSDMNDSVQVVPPLVGNSVVLVRSDKSWHAVSRVHERCSSSRHSMTVTFYQPGSKSTMWPEGDNSPLHSYTGEHSEIVRRMIQRWRRLTKG